MFEIQTILYAFVFFSNILESCAKFKSQKTVGESPSQQGLDLQTSDTSKESNRNASSISSQRKTETIPVTVTPRKSEIDIEIESPKESPKPKKKEASKGRAMKVVKAPPKKPEAPLAKEGYNKELIAAQEKLLSQIFNSKESDKNTRKIPTKPTFRLEVNKTQSLEGLSLQAKRNAQKPKTLG